MGAAGAGGAEKIYVEDVFSTWLYTGNGSTQTITNGIDLSGKGGLVWIKGRSGATGHRFTDTARGATKSLASDSTAAEATESTGLTSFSSTGFALGADADYSTNAATYASWTFRKAAKFFDVVTYTGTGANRTIAHSLGSVPGTIIVKRTDTTGDWQVYHRSLANTEYLVLNATAAKATGTTRWNSTTPTSTEFSLGTDITVNASGGTYVAYLFAHDAGGFGDSGNDSVVKCGSFTADGSGNAAVTLGWEPQWLLVKRSDGTGRWLLYDTMRGWAKTNYNILYANLSNAEIAGTGESSVPTATGFQFGPTGGTLDPSGTYIYIAIRHGPMKTPTDATKVFDVELGGSIGTSSTPAYISGFPVDMYFLGGRSNSDKFYWADRLRGNTTYLNSTSTAAETNWGTNGGFDHNNGCYEGGALGSNYPAWMFRRAPGFFDVVAYTGTGAARTVNHNLAVAPELMIIKQRSGTEAWPVYSSSLAIDRFLRLNNNGTPTIAPRWNSTAPTSAVFSLGSDLEVNGSGSTYIAYLFASCPGVSKVGSYTGTGTTLNIDCGFTAGARFVLIKRTDNTGDWHVWDTARGIISGNDPYLLLNSTAAEVTNTDYSDPLNSGFQISSTAPAAINAAGGSFIFLAVA